MKHKNIEKLIQKSLDREINAEEEQKLSSHLTHCQACRHLYQEFTSTEQMLDELINVFPGHGFNERILRKISVRRGLVWKRAAIGFACFWAASLVLLISSPLPGEVLSRFLTSIPALMHLFDNIRLVMSSLNHVLMPLAKISWNLSFPIVGLVFSTLLFYFFGKTLSPVRKSREDTKSYSHGRDF